MVYIRDKKGGRGKRMKRIRIKKEREGKRGGQKIKKKRSGESLVYYYKLVIPELKMIKQE